MKLSAQLRPFIQFLIQSYPDYNSFDINAEALMKISPRIDLIITGQTPTGNVELHNGKFSFVRETKLNNFFILLNTEKECISKVQISILDITNEDSYAYSYSFDQDAFEKERKNLLNNPNNLWFRQHLYFSINTWRTLPEPFEFAETSDTYSKDENGFKDYITQHLKQIPDQKTIRLNFLLISKTGCTIAEASERDLYAAIIRYEEFEGREISIENIGNFDYRLSFESTVLLNAVFLDAVRSYLPLIGKYKRVLVDYSFGATTFVGKDYNNSVYQPGEIQAEVPINVAPQRFIKMLGAIQSVETENLYSSYPAFIFKTVTASGHAHNLYVLQNNHWVHKQLHMLDEKSYYKFYCFQNNIYIVDYNNSDRIVEINSHDHRLISTVPSSEEVKKDAALKNAYGSIAIISSYKSGLVFYRSNHISNRNHIGINTWYHLDANGFHNLGNDEDIAATYLYKTLNGRHFRICTLERSQPKRICIEEELNNTWKRLGLYIGPREDDMSDTFNHSHRDLFVNPLGELYYIRTHIYKWETDFWCLVYEVHLSHKMHKVCADAQGSLFILLTNTNDNVWSIYEIKQDGTQQFISLPSISEPIQTVNLIGGMEKGFYITLEITDSNPGFYLFNWNGLVWKSEKYSHDN